ncbi:MAG: hypothetical protein IKS48_08700 [Eubacterium sp.]|nr:hypothetical protein [Eubacterium sp.]
MLKNNHRIICLLMGFALVLSCIFLAPGTISYADSEGAGLDREKIKTELTITIPDARDGSILIVLKNAVDYVPIGGATLSVDINDDSKTYETDETPIQIPIKDFKDGKYTITVNYSGSDAFEACSATKDFELATTKEEPTTSEATTEQPATEAPAVPEKISTKLSGKPISTSYKSKKNLVVSLKDSNGNPLRSFTIHVKLDTKSYDLNTNSNGEIQLSINNLAPGNHTAKISYYGDSNYKESSTSIKIKITKGKAAIKATSKTFKVKTKNKKYTVTLRDSDQKPIKKAKIIVIVNGKKYTATTNSTGKATFTLYKLTKKGTYKASIKYSGDKYYKSISKKVKITVK